jgi:plastocyanin
MSVEMAGPPPRYLPDSLTVRSGHTRFFLTNISHGTHTIAIGRGPLKLELGRATNVPLALSGYVAINTSVTFSVDELPPGAYVLWCTVGDHAELGMSGTLTVNP